MYVTLSGSTFDKLVKPNLMQEYKSGGKAELLTTRKYCERTPAFYKTEFVAKRMIALSNKCYYSGKGPDYAVKKQNKRKIDSRTNLVTKRSKKNRNKMTRERHYNTLSGEVSEVNNRRFIVNKSQMLTYAQHKLGLNAY